MGAGMFLGINQQQEDKLSELLELWHTLEKGGVARGFNNKALVVGDCRGWRLQYDGQQDQLDADREKLVAEIIDLEVGKMSEPHRTAIYFEARNLVTGNAVWRSPRLPDDAEQRKIIVRYARWQLARRLIAIGVL